MHLSAKLHDAPRAGYFKPHTVAPGVDTVAVPNFDLDLLGHGYFAQAEALLHDIHDLMRHIEAPGQRPARPSRRPSSAGQSICKADRGFSAPQPALSPLPRPCSNACFRARQRVSDRGRPRLSMHFH